MSYNILELVDAHVQSGDLDTALELLNPHLSAHPTDDDARRWRVAILMHLPGDDRQQAALADLDAIGTPIPDDVLRRSIALQTLGELKAAQSVIRDALKHWPADEQLTERLLYLLTLAGDHANAERVLATLPRTWRWLLWAGEVAAETARDTDAIAAYSDALIDLERSLDTADPFAANIKAQILLGRAQVHATIGAFYDADDDYAAAQALLPNDSLLLFKRGLLASLQGDLIQALSVCGDALTQANEYEQSQMEHILRTDPRHAPLAMLLLQGEGDL
jgi:tetratricopeptide (TPR) repeat protein